MTKFALTTGTLLIANFTQLQKFGIVQSRIFGATAHIVIALCNHKFPRI